MIPAPGTVWMYGYQPGADNDWNIQNIGAREHHYAATWHEAWMGYRAMVVDYCDHEDRERVSGDESPRTVPMGHSARSILDHVEPILKEGLTDRAREHHVTLIDHTGIPVDFYLIIEPEQ